MLTALDSEPGWALPPPDRDLWASLPSLHTRRQLGETAKAPPALTQDLGCVCQPCCTPLCSAPGKLLSPDRLLGQGCAWQPPLSPWASLTEECPGREGLTLETES